MMKEAQIIEALKGVNDPELGKSLVELGMVHDQIIPFIGRNANEDSRHG